ncbi:MAG: hypothetical protein IPP66_07320 [Anaerolineales bacterium]|nr:hypothetical protein [Anaerolineales bacterium]
MLDEQNPTSDPNQKLGYQIRIKGYLGQQWMDWFEGLSVTLDEDGTTCLSGIVVDQSALHGILKKIRDLGMPLLSVNPIASEQDAKVDLEQDRRNESQSISEF